MHIKENQVLFARISMIWAGLHILQWMCSFEYVCSKLIGFIHVTKNIWNKYFKLDILRNLCVFFPLVLGCIYKAKHVNLEEQYTISNKEIFHQNGKTNTKPGKIVQAIV